MAMLGIIDQVQGVKVGITLIGNTYGGRLNVKEVMVEDFNSAELSESTIMALEEEVVEQIWKEKGYYFDWFNSLLSDYEYSEICMVGKY